MRLLGQGRDWSICEYICTAGPGDRPFEERREQVTIAAVLEGAFRYKSDTGTVLLHQGALLLGNPETCFECGHDHSSGDRCVALHFSPEYFAEVAASVGGTRRFRFPVGMLPALPKVAPWLANIEAGLARADRLEADEAISDVMQLVISVIAGVKSTPVRLSALDEKRIGDALRHIEDHADDPLTLGQLAAVAEMSKYHFLRTFRRTVGMTPYQLLLSMRMRRAAVALLTSSKAVSAIAFDTGFGDLSTFNGRFRAQFGDSPSAYREKRRRTPLSTRP